MRYIKISIAVVVVVCSVSYVFSELRDSAFYADIYVWYPDGRVECISPSPLGVYVQPHINTAGTEVIFFGNKAGPLRIWKSDLQNSKTTALTPPDYGARHPFFSYGGGRIVFASDMMSGEQPETIEQIGKDGRPPPSHTENLFIMDSDGGNVRQVTFGPYQDQRPCFSPNGATIVFTSNRGGDARLWSVAADAKSDPKPLQEKGNGRRPCFSSDGQWIYFFSRIEDCDRICRISANGGEVQPLTNDTSSRSHGPFADPTGESVLVHSYECGKWNLWELPLDGSPRRRVQPQGFPVATHATRSRNGVIAFDRARNQSPLRELAASLKRFYYTVIGCDDSV